MYIIKVCIYFYIYFIILFHNPRSCLEIIPQLRNKEIDARLSDLPNAI